MLTVVFSVVLSFSGCTSFGAPSPDVSSFDALVEWSAQYWSEVVPSEVPGVSAIFFTTDGPVQVIHYGFSDVERTLPVTEATVFQVASISKPVTAYGVLQLVENGLVELDAPVEEFLRSYRFPHSRRASDGVTIRRLLNHTAGLSVTGYPGFSPEKRLPSIEESLAGKTGRFFGVYSPGPVKIIREPGAGWKYSGGGYTVLQLMIQDVSGMPFDEYMEEHVLTALGMESSTFDPDRVVPGNLASGYNAGGKVLPNYRFTAKAAAGLYSTAGDLALLLQDLAAGAAGQPGVLTALSYTELTRQYITVEGPVAMGLGFHLETLPDGSILAHHYGGNRGWQSFFGVNLDSGEGLVILTNSNRGVGRVIDPVVEGYRTMAAKRGW